MSDIFDELQWRGLVAQTTDETALREALDKGPLTVYCGFDPTAPSLHFGAFPASIYGMRCVMSSMYASHSASVG